MSLSKEELANWFADPTTKKIRKILEQRANDIMVGWANNKYSTVVKAEFAKGRINGIMEIFDIEGDDK